MPRPLDPDKVLASGLTVRETLVFSMAANTRAFIPRRNVRPDFSDDEHAKAIVKFADIVIAELARQPDPPA